MKKLIDRRDYEIYFMKVEKKRPGKKTVREYLRANHPYFTKACSFYSHECKICGQIFEMITVFHQRPERRGFSSIATFRTASEIIANSSFAEKECTVQYDGEYFSFGSEPVSLYHGNTDLQCDYSIKTRTELLDLAKKEKIFSALFMQRAMPCIYIFAFGLAIACSVLILPGMVRWKNISTESDQTATQKLKSEAINEELSFWEIFAEETSIVHKSGGIFREYYYNGNLIPNFNHIIYKSDPEKMSAFLQTEHRLRNISYPQIGLEKDEYLLRVQYSMDAAGINNSNDAKYTAYSEIASFRKFCTANTWLIADLRIESVPIYQLHIAENSFSEFVVRLASYCDTKKIEPKIFHITNSADGKSVDLAFIESPKMPEKNIAIDTTLLHSVFTPQTMAGKQFENKSVSKKNSKQNITSSNIPIIGKISADGHAPVIFSKTDSGKIIISEGDIP